MVTMATYSNAEQRHIAKFISISGGGGHCAEYKKVKVCFI